MKWLVIWFVTTMIIVPCPQPVPTPDEFGRAYLYYTTTLAVCSKSETKRMERTFSIREEAETFIERGKAEEAKRNPYGTLTLGGSKLHDWELKEIEEK